MDAEIPSGNRRWDIEIPTFGRLLRQHRESRGLSRERLAFGIGVSGSYIVQLEKSTRRKPTREVVDAIGRYLDRIIPLTPVEQRQFRDLAGVDNGNIPTLAELRAAITPDLRSVLTSYQHPAAYMASGGYLLDVNQGWLRSMPGSFEMGNIYHWIFGHEMAKRVMVDWQADSIYTVQILRFVLGTPWWSTRSAELLRELAVYPEFRRAWNTGGVQLVPPAQTFRVRDLDDGEPRKVLAQSITMDFPGKRGVLVMVFILPC